MAIDDRQIAMLYETAWKARRDFCVQQKPSSDKMLDSEK